MRHHRWSWTFFKKRRRALGTSPEDLATEEGTRPVVMPNLGLMPGYCKPRLCGGDTACRQFSNKTHACVCPHDMSMPTADLKCPNRLTVPLTPRPIHNIMLAGRNNSTTLNATTAKEQQAERSSHDGLLPAQALIIGLLAACIVAVTLAVTVCLWKKKELQRCMGRSGKSRKHSCSPSPLSLSKGLLVADRFASNPNYTICTPPDPIAVPLLTRDSLRFLNVIGEGCFGKVYKGELRTERDGSPEVVAVKVLKESAMRETEEDFLREVDIMSTFRHANILSLLGVVLGDAGSSPWMVFEFMPHGDLVEVLRSSHGRHSRPGLPPLTKETLLAVAVQIAAGMSYLASQRFVHRDLACRNCLVGDDLVVKIADFGMSRDIYTCDYYKTGKDRPMPVRWMSPESVVYGRFTLESDVWSYGVVLWEIYSLGKQPYYGHSNEEALKLILQGIMLIPPDNCPPVVCDLMRACWKTEPKDRIRFSDIHQQLLKARCEPEERLPPTSLPRPPRDFPMEQFRLEDEDEEEDQALDRENYLLPQISGRRDYLQPLPD